MMLRPLAHTTRLGFLLVWLLALLLSTTPTFAVHATGNTTHDKAASAPSATPITQPPSLEVDTDVDEVSDGECNNDCTLREALALISGGGTITFHSSLNGKTIALTQGQLSISRSMTINASSLSNGLTIDAQGNSRVFDVPNASNTVVIDGLTITNGTTRGAGIRSKAKLTVKNSTITGNSAAGNRAGGMYNDGGRMTIQYSTLSNNTAAFGGALYNYKGTVIVEYSTVTGNTASSSGGGLYNKYSNSTMTVNNSTISGNAVTGGTANSGGGIYNIYYSTLIIQNSTITDNTADYQGSGIDVDKSTLTIRNSVIANSFGNGEDCRIDYSDSSVTISNLVNEDGSCFNASTEGTNGNLVADPMLDVLADNGGPTLTHLPLTGSPLIDAGDAGTCLATDQRGESRDDGACDIGAVEIQPVSVGVTLTVSLWLEGPWNESGMTTDLSDYLPQNDPYSLGQSVANADFFTDNAQGQNVTDWIWIELRSGNPGTGMTTVATSAALLLSGGSVKALDATNDIAFSDLPRDAYYLVVGHRNHLSVMSATEIDCSSGACSYDFTTAQSAAYTQGPDPLTDLSGAGPFALIAADANANGLVSASDETLWLSERGSTLGYHDTDLDLNGLVGASDQAFWLMNRGQEAQVPAAGSTAMPTSRQASSSLLPPDLPGLRNTSSQ